jgi:exosortase A-associated hydrolase 2
MSETPFFIESGPHQLFAVLHEPKGPARDEAFVFCHPLAEEKLWTHRAFVTFARQLAHNGHWVLRADLTGSGDSDGDFSDVSVTSAITDIRRMVDEVRRRSRAPRVSLLGLRFGATLASLAAERNGDIDRLVLWAPIVDGDRHLQDLLRINVATQTAVYKEVRLDRGQLIEQMRQGGTVNIEGYEMAGTMCTEMAAINLAAAPKAHRGPCLVVQIDRQPGRPAADLQALASSYERGTLTMAQEEPFWREIARFYDRAPSLFGATSEWLEASA